MSAAEGPLRVERRAGVVNVTIAHPPSNVLDGDLLFAVVGLLDQLETDPEVRIVVFRSADPDFFVMHADVTMLVGLPDRPHETVTEPNVAAASFARFASAPFLSVGVLEGAARGGGAELFAALDLRVATPSALLGQPEVAMGILPGAGGTARLPHLLGRGRALEVVLSGRDLGAEEAHRWGWIDVVLDPAEVDQWLATLTDRVGRMPAASVAAVKDVVATSLREGLEAALVVESDHLDRLMASGAHRDRMTRYLDAGGQTRDGEKGDTAALIEVLLAEPSD